MSPGDTKFRGIWLHEALRRLAARLEMQPEGPVEILIVGGAAGLLGGFLAPGRMTQDCDVMVWTPEESWPRLEAAAAVVARELDLPDAWLNDGARVFVHRLLPGWASRRRSVLVGRELTVFVPSRVDYLAAKLLAGRDVDLDDVIAMQMTADEHAFIRRAFDAWPPDHFAAETIPVALERLDAIAMKEVVE